MSTDHIKSEILAYLVGGLPESRNRQIEAHVAGCEKCRQALSKARAKQAHLKREALKKASTDRVPNLFLARQGKQMGSGHPSSKWPWLLGGILLVGGASYWILRGPVSYSPLTTTPVPPAPPAPLASPAGSPSAPSPQPPKPSAVLQVQREWKGSESAIKEMRLVVVRNSSAWEKLWAEMQTSEPAPSVNFEQHVVVGVFAGEQAHGATIFLGSIREMEDEVPVPFRMTSPEAAVSTATVPSHPYLLSLLPRVDKKIRLTQKESSP